MSFPTDGFSAGLGGVTYTLDIDDSNYGFQIVLKYSNSPYSTVQEDFDSGLDSAVVDLAAALENVESINSVSIYKEWKGTKNFNL